MSKGEDREQIEPYIQENQGPPIQYNQQYIYPPGQPAMGYPYNPNVNQNYPAQPDPSCNPNQQFAPMYIAPGVNQPAPLSSPSIPQVPIGKFERKPMTMTCPTCHETMNTIIKRRPGLLIFLLVVLLVVCFWPAFFVPFLFFCWYDVYHSCGKCKASLGARKILG